MMIPTEPIGSIPRPQSLIEAAAIAQEGSRDLELLDEEAVRDTMERFEATGSHIESPEHVCDRVFEALRYIPAEQLGTTDDCGFSPFCDDTTTTRDTAFANIEARVRGTAMAARILGDS